MKIKNIWFAFWSELLLIFRNPRDVHRVIITAPLAVVLSHAIYLYNLTPESVFNTADKTAIALGSFIYLMTVLWCLLSNPMNIHLFNRFSIVAALTVLYHQVFFYSVGLGDTYPKILSTIAYALLMIWAVTGKNYRDFIKDHVQPKVNSISKLFIRNEKKDNIRLMSDAKSSAVNE
jgi:hypothetical protein